MAVVLVLAVLALVRAGACLGDGASLAHLVDEARGIEDWLLQVRRTFHAHPELMYQELNTSSTIRRLLDEMNIPYRYPVAKTGLVATIGTGSPVVALRTDIDALPILEDTGFDFSSTNPGVMHACGHDAHMTMLLGAAKLLKGREGELQGSVKLLFQPAEEGGAGGDVMVKEGALEGAKAAFGMHVWPVLPSGTIASRPGTIMAGSVVFEVVVTGRGGHAAMPHLTADPVVAASAIATSLQTLVSRETSPFGSAVVSVTKLSAGDAYNVIPDTVTIGGTVRTTSDEQMKALQQRIEELVSHQAAALRCEAQVDWLQDQHPYYPPVVNDPEAYKFAADVATRLVGDARRVVVTEPSMAGEDFSFIARAIPSSFIFLGIRNETAGSVHGLHTPRFTMDEGVMKLGVALHTALATEYLRQYHAQQQGAGEGGAGGVGVNDEL